MRPHDPLSSPGEAYYRRVHGPASPPPAAEESALLSRIRSILSPTKSSNSGEKPRSFTSQSPVTSQREEVAWFGSRVVHSDGASVRRIWNFEVEGQDVQCACWVWLPVPVPVSVEQDNIPVSNVPIDPDKQATFGAFASLPQTSPWEPGPRKPLSLARGLCIFLRDVGRVFFPDGDEYTFHVPFLVRAAWGLYPSGLIVQREIEPDELIQPLSERLPTLYTLSHPLEEFKVVPISETLVGQVQHGLFQAKDDLWNIWPWISPTPFLGSVEETSSLDPDEVFVWLPDRMASPNPVAISYSKQDESLSIWLMLSLQQPTGVPPASPSPSATVEKKDLPTTQESTEVPRQIDRRRSRKGLNNQGAPVGPGDRDRRVSARLPSGAADTRTAMRLFSGSKPVDAETVQLAAAGTAMPGQPGQVPNEYPQLNTLQDPFAGASRPTAESQESGDLSDEDKMSPDVVLKRLQTIPLIGDQDLDQLGVHVFDTRETRSLLAILLPSQRLLIYALRRHPGNLSLEFRVEMPAVSATTIVATRPDVPDLLIVCPDGSISILLTDSCVLHFRLCGQVDYPQSSLRLSGVTMRTIDSGDMWDSDELRVKAVSDAVSDCVTFTLEEEERVRIDLGLLPNTPLTKTVLETLCYALPPEVSFSVMSRWLKDRNAFEKGTDDFACLANVLLDFLLPDTAPYSQAPAEKTQASAWDAARSASVLPIMATDPSLKGLRQPALPAIIYPTTIPVSAPSPYIAPVVLALHLLAEDIRMNTTRFQELPLVVRLVVRLATVAQRDWVQYWLRVCPAVADAVDLTSEALHIGTIDQRLDFRPPDLAQFLGSFFTDLPQVPYISLQELGPLFGLEIFNLMGSPHPCLRTRFLIDVYTVLKPPGSTVLNIAQAVHRMAMCAVTPLYLDTVPFGVALPLREVARKASYRPASSAPPRFYQLLGRKDILMTIFGPDRRMNLTDSYKQRNEPDMEPQQSIAKLYGEAYANLAGRAKEETTGVGDQRLHHFTDVRFPDDYRLREVETILRSSRTCVIRVQDRADASEHELANEHQILLMRIAERTLSLPLGRAALTFATVPTAQADSYAVPKMEFAVRILPQGTVLTPEGLRLTDEVRLWTDFNNAVAAALRISPTSEGVDGSWIILNKPPEPSPEHAPHHAGFIYGLGLTGHLRSMQPFQAFRYLARKDIFTTIAVLLGLSAAHYGTGNETVTQMISVHTPALLPPDSAELNIPVLTQAAGLTGLGLLYLGTRNRRMARVALQEITRRDLAKPGQTNEHRECYTLTAAFAFGMIMLGKGGQSNPADMAYVQRLQLLVEGEPPSVDQIRYHKPSFDVTITSPAATVALMLMFLRTERKDVADILRRPRTKEDLADYAPYLIMIRTIARSVIMWNNISLSEDWLQANLPEFLSIKLQQSQNTANTLGQLDDASGLAYMYTVAGLCFAIGLRWVGTAEPEALSRLSMLHDAVNKAMVFSLSGYDQRIKRFAHKECVGTIQLSMAMVAAGTGNLSIFQRLRVAHGQYTNVRYGTHVATHLALGLLFLGGGRYTLGNSNAAIACLIASLYPRFPNNAADNRAHPQVLRHLWVLAAEPRCLLTRDVDTGKIVGLPIRMRKLDASGNEIATRFMAPSLLPEIDRIVSLEVDSPRYWPLGLDIMNNPRHRASIIRTQTMWVKRHPGFLTYEEDLRGMRSLSLHTNVAYLDTLALDFPSEQPLKPEVSEHINHFIQSHAHSMRTVAFAKYLCQVPGRSPRENALFAFSQAALVECLALDKPNMLHPYLTVFLSRYDDPRDNPGAVTMVQTLRQAWNFYESQFSRFLDEGMSINRSVLLRPTVIQTALAEAEKRADSYCRSPVFLGALRHYVRGERLDEGVPQRDVQSLTQELLFFLAVHNVPPLLFLLEIRKRLNEAGLNLVGTSQLDLRSWTALILMKANSALAESGEVENQMSARAVDEVIKAWTMGE